jgi:hypothetical protein
MVFPVRIRVPLLKKALQIEEIERTPAELLAPRDKGVSTAGSRRGFFWRGCGVGVDGEGHSIIVRKPKPEAFRPTLALHPGSREVPEAGRCALHLPMVVSSSFWKYGVMLSPPHAPFWAKIFRSGGAHPFLHPIV